MAPDLLILAVPGHPSDPVDAFHQLLLSSLTSNSNHPFLTYISDGQVITVTILMVASTLSIMLEAPGPCSSHLFPSLPCRWGVCVYGIISSGSSSSSHSGNLAHAIPLDATSPPCGTAWITRFPCTSLDFDIHLTTKLWTVCVILHHSYWTVSFRPLTSIDPFFIPHCTCCHIPALDLD